MKRTLAFFVCLMTTCSVYAGGPPRFLANINGSAFKQVKGDNGSRVERSPINNQRIFEEFGVSQEDYALVLDVNAESLVSLVPRSSTVKLPVIYVILRSDVHTASNGKLRTSMFETPVGNSDAEGTLFQDLRGTMFGSLKFSESDELLKFNATVTGSSNADSIIVKDGTAKGLFTTGILLKFKVTRGAPFTVAP